MSLQCELSGRVGSLNWGEITSHLQAGGYAHVKSVLNKKECAELISTYDISAAFRKTVSMERYRFGKGEYKYWKYPLPDVVEILRKSLYERLVPIVNDWNSKLKIDQVFPQSFNDMQHLSHQYGQLQATPLMLKYQQGGFNTLHQDLYGELFFPLQAVFCLNEPDEDYTGGEFVLSEQIPRAQSKATVLRPFRGDMIIFTTNYRPIQGARGYYRAKMRHGVSEVHSGSRNTVGIIFHDAEK